jgi:hypothetical protein
MTRDIKCYVTRVEQKEPPTEDISTDPIVPPVTGGVVIFTAQSSDGLVGFATDVTERVAVGDEVHVRIDYGVPLDRSPS